MYDKERGAGTGLKIAEIEKTGFASHRLPRGTDATGRGDRPALRDGRIEHRVSVFVCFYVHRSLLLKFLPCTPLNSFKMLAFIRFVLRASLTDRIR